MTSETLRVKGVSEQQGFFWLMISGETMEQESKWYMCEIKKGGLKPIGSDFEEMEPISVEGLEVPETGTFVMARIAYEDPYWPEGPVLELGEKSDSPFGLLLRVAVKNAESVHIETPDGAIEVRKKEPGKSGDI